jgi:hypothetical protein
MAKNGPRFAAGPARYDERMIPDSPFDVPPGADSLPQSAARPPLSDSPWFWAAVFCATAVAFLLVIWPQYAKRQRRLEMQYYARREIERRQVEGTPQARPPGEEGAEAPPAVGELIIPLWPLVVLFAILLTVSSAMLWRQRSAPALSPPARGAP